MSSDSDSSIRSSLRWRLTQRWRTKRRVASFPLILATLVFVIIGQIPPQFLMNAGFVFSGIAINEIAIIAGIPLFLIWYLKLDVSKLLRFGMPTLKQAMLVLLITICADVIIDYLTIASELWIPLPAQISSTYDKLMAVDGIWNFIWKAGMLCLLPAICEEIFFRGFCQGSFLEGSSKLFSIGASAFIFSLLHGNPWYFHLYFLLGIMMGWISMRTGMLLLAILSHAINNAWTFCSHVAGFKFPIGDRMGMLDGFLIFICAISIVLLAAYLANTFTKRLAPRFAGVISHSDL